MNGDLNKAALAEDDWDLVADPLVGVDPLDGEAGIPFRWVLTLLSCMSPNGHRESISAIASNINLIKIWEKEEFNFEMLPW